MALTVRDDGTIVIKTDTDAANALKMFRELKAERDAIFEEAGLADIEKDLVSYKAAVTNYMIAKKKKSIPGSGYHGTLVEGFDGRWDMVKLRRILKKKENFKEIWNTITTRTLDAEKLNEAVEEGMIKAKEIQAAWVEVPRRPYLRLFEESDNGNQ